MRTYLGSVHDGWIFVGMVVYFLSMTLLIPSPWFPYAPGFTFPMSLLWSSVPLVIGLLRFTPSSVTSGFVLASLGPFNQTTVLLGFGLGVLLGVITLIKYKNRYRELFSGVFVQRGFHYLLALTLYIVFVWLIRLGDTTDWWSFLALASSLLTVPFAAYSLSYLDWNASEIKRTARLLFYIGLSLAGVALLYPLICGRFEQYTQAVFVLYKSINVIAELPVTMEWIDPDFNRVSLTSSHYFAVIMLLFALGAALAGILKKKYWLYGSISAIALYCFALGENAHIIPGAIAGLIVLVLVMIAAKLKVSASLVSFGAVSVAVLGIVVMISVLYFNNGRYSLTQKAGLYNHAVNQILDNPSRMLLGEGPAAYASRAANKRLSNPDLEIEYSFPFAIPNFSNPAFSMAVFKARSLETASTMKRPLSGAAGIVMEWGIIGTLFILYLLYRLSKSVVSTYIKSRSVSAKVLSVSGLFGLVLLTVSLSVRTYYEYAELSSVVSVLLMVSIVAAPQVLQQINNENNIHTS